MTTIPQGGTGDVKYHHGAQGTYQLPDDASVIVTLESNPSHLEYVTRSSRARTRAVQTTRQGPHAHIDTNAAVPIILHGDAAFPGQGVVAETLNLQALDGYTVGGTLHLIQNNQVGFTTDPDERALDPLGLGPRQGLRRPDHPRQRRRRRGVRLRRAAGASRSARSSATTSLIDLIGYRRFGHNEADEPAYTQPEMAAKIKDQAAGPRALRRPARRARASSRQEEADAIAQGDLGRHGRAPPRAQGGARRPPPSSRPAATSSTARPRREVKTAVSADTLRGAQRGAAARPRGLQRPPASCVKQLERRREALGPDGGIDWAHAEALAFASLLSEGTPVRLTGQDVERGTFSPAPPRAARRQDRPAHLADPAPAGRARADGAAQLAAVRDRVPGLRVRLLDGGAGDARAVGGAVRRLRQLAPR